METSSVPYFLLEWLKENTGHYQYLTAEAQDLKASIESMMPQSDELNIKECELYWKFLAMLEENPFTAYNQEGIPAQIMADDFYYYFYPVSDQDELWYPMELYVKLGSVSTTEKARQMYERMLESIGWWKEDFIQNTEKRRNKKAKELLSGSAQVEDIHGHLLDKGWFSFIILELLLLGMSGLGVFRFVCAYFVNGRKDLLDIKSLKGLSFGIAGMVCMTLLVKALIFLVQDGKRQRLLLAWKNRETEQKNDTEKVKAEFRSEEGLKNILKQLLLEKTYIPASQVIHKGTGNEDETVIELKEFLEPKTERILNTVRPLHVLVAVLACVCMCMVYTEGLPPQISEYISIAQEKILQKIYSPEKIEVSDIEIKAIDAYTNLKVRLISDEAGLYSSLDSDDQMVEYGFADKKFNILGIAKTEGDFWYAVQGDNSTQFINGKDAVLTDGKSCDIKKMNIFYSSGEKIKTKLLTDGVINTGNSLKRQDILKIALSKKVKLGCMYIINGLTENGFAAGIKSARISFGNEEESYLLSFPAKASPEGYFVCFPEVETDSVTIEILDVEAADAGISEVFLYPAENVNSTF